MSAKLLDVGLTPQVFVDDTAIEQAIGCSRRVNPAVKHPDGPVLFRAHPQPWKYLQVWSVLRDDEAGTYQMWYQTYTRKMAPLRYATSTDGVNWELPNLGNCELDGSKDNNVLVDSTGRLLPGRACVRLNPDKSDPARKYICLFQTWHYYVGYSPNGIDWDIDFDHIAWERGSGDGLGECYFAMYDPRISKWRAYVRVWIDNNSIRTSGYGESRDMTSWSGPKVQYVADSEWGLGAQIYDWCAWQDAGIYWAMPHVYQTDMHPDLRQQQTTHMGLVYSRDGENWQAVDKTTDYIPLGETGQFDSHGIYHYPAPILLADEVLFYYTGCSHKHDDPSDRGATGIGRAVGRRGRYVGLEADAGREGVIMSRPFQMCGDQLLINAAAGRGGWVKAEFLNPSGQIIKTFDLAESADAFSGDAADYLMTWNGSGSLQRILGEKLRLRLRFVDAQVFGFRLGESREGIAAVSAGPAPLSCRTTDTPPVIDGDLADSVWENFTAIATIEDFVHYDKVEPAPVKSTVYLTRDAEALYMGFDLAEPDMDRLVATRRQGDADLYNEECIQIELQPGGPEDVVTVLYFSPKAVTHQLRIDPSRSHSGTHDSNPSWEAAAALAEARWTAELRIPYASLGVEPPKPGDRWRMNIHRFRHTQGQMEVYSWVCIFGQFSRHDRRGELLFQ